MSKVPSMSKLLENFRSVQEANYNPRKNLTEQELVYDIIKEVLSLRDDVAIRLNTIDEQLKILKDIVGEKDDMIIDPNPFDDTDGVVNGKVVNPMNIDKDGSHLRSRRRGSDLLDAKLEKRR